MAKTELNWYKHEARNIVKELRLLKQREIAEEMGTTQQNVSYLFRSGWFQKTFEDVVKLLKLAGYELVRREED